MMIKFGKWIAKHKVIIVIISMLLLIPSFLGMAATRVNYDILSYLPESLETVEGQDIMVDEFGMGGTGTTGHTGIVRNPWDKTRMTAGSSAASRSPALSLSVAAVFSFWTSSFSPK